MSKDSLNPITLLPIAEIAERYAANQLSDTAGMQIASMYRCIATVFREADKSRNLGKSAQVVDENGLLAESLEALENITICVWADNFKNADAKLDAIDKTADATIVKIKAAIRNLGKSEVVGMGDAPLGLPDGETTAAVVSPANEPQRCEITETRPCENTVNYWKTKYLLLEGKMKPVMSPVSVDELNRCPVCNSVTLESGEYDCQCLEAYEAAKPKEQPDELSKIAKVIHYPSCWDVAVYPTIYDALYEMAGCVGCSECKPMLTRPDADQKPIERESVSHSDLCRLGRVFNHHADLADEVDRRINDWLKIQIGDSYKEAKPCDHRWVIGKDRVTRCRRCLNTRVEDANTVQILEPHETRMEGN